MIYTNDDVAHALANQLMKESFQDLGLDPPGEMDFEGKTSHTCYW